MKPEDYYRRHAKLGNVDGVWQNHVNKNKARELLENSKIFEDNINNPKVPSGKPGDLAPGPYKDLVEKEERALRTLKVQPKVLPKFRAETMLERIERISYEYGEATVKPKHLNNPNIISAENWKMKPEKWDGYHNLTNDQKQQATAWDIHLNIAKKPRSPEERREALDTKRMLMKTYNNPKLKNTLADDELKLIGKHKSQQPEVTPIARPVVARRVPFIPSPSVNLDEFIKEKSRLKPGISEDLIILNKEINKNIKYVLGEDQKEQTERMSEKSEYNNNKEETHD